MEDISKDAKTVRWGVFAPMFCLIFSAVVLGIFHSETLISLAKDFFNWSLQNFGWLYQWISMLALILVGVLLVSRYGHIRIGGKDAKAKMSFSKWFAMALSSGIATGLITYGANEPIIYFGNVYGELNQTGVEANTHSAAIWALGRVFYNWGFVPYAMYTLSGVIAAYMYFNRKKGLSVSATLEPILGKYARNKFIASVVDVLATLAIVLGLASGLGTGLTVVVTGLKISYGINATTSTWVILGALTTFLFTFSSYIGLDKGFKILASIKSKILYALLILLFITGPTIYILRTSTAGMATWLHNFFLWGLDPIDIGGAALTQWWTLFDWAVWVAYAPLMGLFLAMISYGRTLKEFIIINWILPSCFALFWFAVWGGTSLYLQESGALDLVQIIKDNGAVSGLWAFLQHLPFKLGVVIVPLILVLSLFAYAVAANSMTTTIAGMCTKNVPIGEEAPAFQRIIWGVLIGSIAIIMSAFGGGEQGIDGIKYLAVCGGFCVLFIFMLQLLSIIKTFFYDKPTE
ncbi:BCCT transporter [Acinetobacter sp. ANC 4558]|uniref:BCCT family transporter n=1 Tax=Acinetobacter sp. ANC 4558 TaxID=1977876 RepID=UPI000A353A5B|nr:BCCT family transporter [Acinetobacter sp. ANC 4558]OTG84210.1 BCCT transporter [Acinetobacter sp. ANC 4558]